MNSVEVKKLDATVTNMKFFERLKSLRIVRENGLLVKRDLDFINECEITDRLRESLADSSSEHYQKINDQMANEFVFKIFRMLVLGGRLCQYEDSIKPYLTTTKALYKDCVR